MNYLIDEAEACGKGANATVSFLHHYLEYYSVGEKVCNCIVITVQDKLRTPPQFCTLVGES